MLTKRSEWVTCDRWMASLRYARVTNMISFIFHRLLDSLVVECWLRVREVPGAIPSQAKVVIIMVPVVLLFGTEHSKGKILALSQELR